MNSGISIHTHFLEEYLRGNLELHIVKSPTFPQKALEMELLSHGYSSMQNKLKHYLLTNRIGRISEKAEQADVLELPRDYAYRAILETKRICVLRTDAEDNGAVSQAIHNYITDDYEEVLQAIEQHSADKENLIASKTVFFYPKVDEDSNALMSAAIALAGKELYRDAELNESQQRNVRRLLTQKSRKQSDTRQDLIRAAYRLKMNIDEMNLFLTKAAFTYKLDLTDPWELRAAYLATYEPVRSDDSPMIFDSRMRMLADRMAAGNCPVMQFLTAALQQALGCWYWQWQEWYSRGDGNAFLLDWCWYTYIYQQEKNARKSTYKSREARLQGERGLSAIYGKLEALVSRVPRQDWLAVLSEESGYAKNLTDCLMDRQFLLLQMLYRHCARRSTEAVSFQIQNRAGDTVCSYTPAFREDGFVHLDRNLRKIENPDRPLSRSDIISLGIELYLDWEDIDQALTIAGFHKLYAKDICERALEMALEAKKQDLSLQELSKHIQLKLQILEQLDTLYSTLSREARMQLEKAEPEWIRRLRKNDWE